MNVSKTGYLHSQIRMNCQDATGSFNNRIKVVCDGCSEGKHSEVGAKLFCKLFIDKYIKFASMKKKYISVPALMMTVMDELVTMVGNNPNDIKDYLSFTIIIVENFYNSNYHVAYCCGDGYIVTQKDEDSVGFEKLDCGEYPKYLSYNYINGDDMKSYSDGVTIDTYEFDDYLNVGVASDGIRFIVDSDDIDLKNEFVNIIKSGKDMKMRLFFNKNENKLKDDFSIVI